MEKCDCYTCDLEATVESMAAWIEHYKERLQNQAKEIARLNAEVTFLNDERELAYQQLRNSNVQGLSQKMVSEPLQETSGARTQDGSISIGIKNSQCLRGLLHSRRVCGCFLSYFGDEHY